MSTSRGNNQFTTGLNCAAPVGFGAAVLVGGAFGVGATVGEAAGDDKSEDADGDADGDARRLPPAAGAGLVVVQPATPAAAIRAATAPSIDARNLSVFIGTTV